MAAGLVGSEILKIAADIREMEQQGSSICNLTVGDFDSAQFPIPALLREALEQGETNYPPSHGVLALRRCLQELYKRELGLAYPLDSFLVSGGARPAIYGCYRAVVDPGDTVVYPVPSWNNNHYCHLLGAEAVAVPCRAESAFMPTKAELAPSLAKARLLCLNSLLNPTGTIISRQALLEICEAIIDENRSREVRGVRPLYLMYDQIYWMLCYGEHEHVTPPGLLPEMAKYTIFVDGISKAFAATGIRVGWAVAPVDIARRMQSILGHVGAWAPKAEQVATVTLLSDRLSVSTYLKTFREGIKARLDALHRGFEALSSTGVSVRSITPMGAIYLTVQISVFGKKTPAGKILNTNEEIRRYLLDQAQVGIVPFQAFGVKEDEGWFRLSVGAVSLEAIDAVFPRIKAALSALTSG